VRCEVLTTVIVQIIVFWWIVTNPSDELAASFFSVADYRQIITNFLKESAISIFRVEDYPKDRGCRFPEKLANDLLDYTAS
jgi:hypothetical protein